jgi:hypothetical protein
MGSSIENTYFIVVSRDGFRIKFTTEGKIKSRETLVKNTVDSNFSLVLEKEGKSYMILRQEPKLLTLIDDNLKTIVTSEFIGNGSAAIQYRDFGAGKVYIAITDRAQELSFIYDAEGKLVTTLPLEGQEIAVRPINLEKIRVFSILERVLTVAPL